MRECHGEGQPGGVRACHFQRREGAGRPRKLYAVERGSLETVTPEHAYKMLSELLVESFRMDENGRPLTPDEAGALKACREAVAARA